MIFDFDKIQIQSIHIYIHSRIDIHEKKKKINVIQNGLFVTYSTKHT